MSNVVFGKSIFREICGYLVGAVAVGTVLLAKGDAVKNVLRLLGLWLPIVAAYGVAVVLLLKRMGLARMAGMLELCGACVGVMPLFCGLWPTYWMRWDLALIIVVVQWVALSLVVLLRVLFQKVVGGGHRGLNGSPGHNDQGGERKVS